MLGFRKLDVPKVGFACVIAIALLISCNSNKTIEYSSANFELIRLSEGVYTCIHKIGGKAICNVGIIDNGNETIIFDSFLSPEVAKELLEIADKFELSPIKYVVNSHAHNDHIRGNQVFASDIDIISTKKTAELIAIWEPQNIAAEKNYAPKQFEYFDSLFKTYKGDSSDKHFINIQMMRPYFEVLSKSHEVVKTRIPNLFVDKQENLDGPARRVQFITKGKGHTESDLVLYLPDDKIIFTGDLVFNESHPYISDGFPEEWKNYLTDLEPMEIITVVPGHGQIGGKEIIGKTRYYIIAIEEIVKKMFQDNISIDAADKMEIPEAYKDWLLEIFFVSNVKFMYRTIDH